MKNFFVLVTFFLALLFQSCVFDSGGWSEGWSLTGLSGEGKKVTKELNVDDFDAVGLSISAQVFLTQGVTQSVRIEAQQNIIDNIRTEVEEGKWKIRFDQNVRRHEGITIWITVPTLTEASISGSGDIIGETPFTGLSDFFTGVSGSGNIDLNIEATNVESSISGSGDIRLSGKCQSLNVKISGAGDVTASELYTHVADVKISGSGDVSVNADEKLDVSISGSGDVHYSGNAKVSAKVSGSGDVKAR